MGGRACSQPLMMWLVADCPRSSEARMELIAVASIGFQMAYHHMWSKMPTVEVRLLSEVRCLEVSATYLHT